MRLLPLVISAAFVSTATAAQVPIPAPSTSRPTFEVASIKANRSGETRSGANAQPGGRVTVISVSLHDLVRIQEQLGLRLEPRQAPVNVLVIESAERPREE